MATISGMRGAVTLTAVAREAEVAVRPLTEKHLLRLAGSTFDTLADAVQGARQVAVGKGWDVGIVPHNGRFTGKLKGFRMQQVVLDNQHIVDFKRSIPREVVVVRRDGSIGEVIANAHETVWNPTGTIVSPIAYRSTQPEWSPLVHLDSIPAAERAERLVGMRIGATPEGAAVLGRPLNGGRMVEDAEILTWPEGSAQRMAEAAARESSTGKAVFVQMPRDAAHPNGGRLGFELHAGDIDPHKPEGKGKLTTAAADLFTGKGSAPHVIASDGTATWHVNPIGAQGQVVRVIADPREVAGHTMGFGFDRERRTAVVGELVETLTREQWHPGGGDHMERLARDARAAGAKDPAFIVVRQHAAYPTGQVRVHRADGGLPLRPDAEMLSPNNFGFRNAIAERWQLRDDGTRAVTDYNEWGHPDHARPLA